MFSEISLKAREQILYDFTSMRYLDQSNSWQKSRILVNGLGEGGNGELEFKGCQVSVWNHDSVLEMDGGDGYVTMWMCLMPLNWMLKKG